MNTIKELLQSADPLLSEAPSSQQRDRIRQRVMGVMTAGSTASLPTAYRAATVLATIVLVVFALFVGSHLFSHGTGELQAAVRFEVRLAEEAPGPGLQEARLRGSDRLIYLHEETVLTNGDIANARTVPAEGSRFSIAVEFNPEGAQKIHAATQAHLGKPVAILIDGEVVMAPVVKSAIDSSAVITGDFTAAQADRIVRGIEIP